MFLVKFQQTFYTKHFLTISMTLSWMLFPVPDVSARVKVRGKVFGGQTHATLVFPDIAWQLVALPLEVLTRVFGAGGLL